MPTDNAENKYINFEIPDYHKTKLKIYNWKESTGEKKGPDYFLHCLYVIPLTSVKVCMNNWRRVWPRMWKLFDRKCWINLNCLGYEHYLVEWKVAEGLQTKAEDKTLIYRFVGRSFPSEVLQGSILSMVLFNIFTNDLEEVSHPLDKILHDE